MKLFKKVIILFVIIFLIICSALILNQLYQKHKKAFYAKDFNIETIISKTDYDKDGIDDYTDVLQGAKKEAENKPVYKSIYYSGRISS